MTSRLESLAHHFSTSKSPAMASTFDNVPLAPADPIFFLTASFKADTNADKVNLGVGAYRDDNGKPWILPADKKVPYHRLYTIITNCARRNVRFWTTRRWITSTCLLKGCSRLTMLLPVSCLVPNTPSSPASA